MVCHYIFVNHAFEFPDYVCNGCHDLTMLCLNLSNISNIIVKYVDYCCIIYNISESDANHLLQNSDHGYV